MEIPTNLVADKIVVDISIDATFTAVSLTMGVPSDAGDAQTVADAVQAGYDAIVGHLATEEPGWVLGTVAQANGGAMVEMDGPS